MNIIIYILATEVAFPAFTLLCYHFPAGGVDTAQHIQVTTPYSWESRKVEQKKAGRCFLLFLFPLWGEQTMIILATENTRQTTYRPIFIHIPSLGTATMETVALVVFYHMFYCLLPCRLAATTKCR